MQDQTKQVNLGFRITETMEKDLLKVAQQDNRKKSDMARVLLGEGIANFLKAADNSNSTEEDSANKQEQQAA